MAHALAKRPVNPILHPGVADVVRKVRLRMAGRPRAGPMDR